MKWILIARRLMLFRLSGKNMETFLALPFTFDWYFSLWKLIITNVKEKWDLEIWALFMNFHSENSGHLFRFPIPQFTHQPGGLLWMSVIFLWLWQNTWGDKLREGRFIGSILQDSQSIAFGAVSLGPQWGRWYLGGREGTQGWSWGEGQGVDGDDLMPFHWVLPPKMCLSNSSRAGDTCLLGASHT